MTGGRWLPDASEPCGPPLRNLVSGPSVGKHSKEDDWFSFQKYLAATWRESRRRQEEAGMASGDRRRDGPVRSSQGGHHSRTRL